MISNWQVNHVKAQSEKLMRQSCLIERATSSNAGDGSIKQEYTTIDADVPCTLTNKRMIAPMDARSGRVASQYEYILHVSADQSIAENDRVTIEGERFRVQNVIKDHQWPVYKRCVVERLA